MPSKFGIPSERKPIVFLPFFSTVTVNAAVLPFEPASVASPAS
ncbi:hypothetical protein [Streptomyces europaeiscabiei]